MGKPPPGICIEALYRLLATDWDTRHETWSLHRNDMPHGVQCIALLTDPSAPSSDIPYQEKAVAHVRYPSLLPSPLLRIKHARVYRHHDRERPPIPSA